VTGLVSVGTARRPAVGQTVCGDVSVVVASAHGTLVCVADGLGHGADASKAATLACDYARENANTPLDALLRGMDRALGSTRGAAVSVILADASQARLQFVGTGNVELRTIARTPIAPPSMPGIVGRGLRSVRVWEYALAEKDLLVLLTDGVSSRFELGGFSHLDPQALAEAVVAKHHKTHDDACCVAVRVGTA
jgi:negative regulator of sigma-B (phosphoserine phosphatase)